MKIFSSKHVAVATLLAFVYIGCGSSQIAVLRDTAASDAGGDATNGMTDAAGSQLVDGSSDASSTWCLSRAAGSPIARSPDECTSGEGVVIGPLSSLVYDGCVQCTPRCGATKIEFIGGGIYYTDQDLPSGQCSNEGEICDMEGTAPIQQCHGQTVGCAVNGYRCFCQSGQWACYDAAQGGGVCAPCMDDAGTDAADSD